MSFLRAAVPDGIELPLHRSTSSFPLSLSGAQAEVLVTPPKPRGDLFGPALVAWNGSAESSAAVALAMPQLAAAKEVGVFTAVEAKHRGEAEELIAYLGWRGIAAKREGTSSPSTAGRVRADLLARADAMGAGLIVMGGYPPTSRDRAGGGPG